MWKTYDFPLPPGGCPAREPGGRYTITHYLSEASLASRRGRSCLDPDPADPHQQDVVENYMQNLSTKENTASADVVSDGYKVCDQLGAYIPLLMLLHRMA